MGTLKANTVQATTGSTVSIASGHALHTNTLKGTTTAGSITVQGEGSNTTNLQQGLAKMWGNYDQRGAVSYTHLTLPTILLV